MGRNSNRPGSKRKKDRGGRRYIGKLGSGHEYTADELGDTLPGRLDSADAYSLRDADARDFEYLRIRRNTEKVFNYFITEFGQRIFYVMDDIHGLLQRLDERSFHMNEKTDDILDQLKKLNSKVAHHESEIHRIKLDLASAQGVWAGVNKTLTIGLTLIGIIAGAIATMLWH